MSERSGSPEGAGPARTGRPRDPGADRRILDATLRLVSERGYAGLRVSEIADRAGVGKATIYRRWSSKAHLVVAAVRSLPAMPDVDSGDLVKDLVSIMGGFVEVFVSTPLSSVLPALVVEAARDPELALAMEPLRRERTRPILVALERGRERGDIDARADADFALALITGPVLARLLLGGEAPPRFVEQVITAAVGALAA